MDCAPPSPVGDDRMAAGKNEKQDGRMQPHASISPDTVTQKRNLKLFHLISSIAVPLANLEP